MTTEELKENILKTTHEILKTARETCVNNFSDNIEFVIRRFDIGNMNFIELNKLRKKTYKKSSKLTIDKVVQELYGDLQVLSWIDLILYKAEQDRTIIEIQLIKRQPNEFVDSQELRPSFHAGIPTPQYATDSHVKFDINWQQNTFNHRLKFFLWKVKTKKEIERLKKKNNVC